MTDDELRQEFMQAFLETANERLGTCLELLGRTGDGSRVEMVRARAGILRELHAFKGEARMMGSEEVGGATEVAEQFLKERSVPLPQVESRLLMRAFEAVLKYVGHEAGTVERSPRAELNALLRLLNRPAQESGDDLTTKFSPPGPVRQPADDDGEKTPSALPTDDAALRRRRSQVAIILVDDSDIVRHMAIEALTGAGYPARGVPDLPALKGACSQQRPQLVLCDYHLEGMTGDEVVRELASDVETAGVPVLIFSGMSEKELASTAEAAGAAGYLPKPDNLSVFVERLDRLADRFARFD